MLISTTITNSRADVIGAALTTIAPEVDVALVIDTGATDDTMRIAADVLGRKLVALKWPWQNDFAAARNFALDQAKEWLKARREQLRQAPEPRAHDPQDWILTADTDEWLRVPGARSVLAALPNEVDVVMVPHVSGTYRQCRAIRATCPGRWHMPVHEYFTPYTPALAPPGWSFECQPRPDEDRTAKYTRYRTTLEALTRREPDNARAWYYLGDTLAILGYKGSAIRAFDRCSRLAGWDEQAAWATYREALLHLDLQLPDFALAALSRGRGRAALPELFWLAGHVHYQAGRWAAAAEYAQAALDCPVKPRAGFCFPAGQREYPAQLLEAARARLATPQRAEAPEESAPRGAGTRPDVGTPPDR